jgi:type IV pilus assembly protein PilB
MLENKQLVDLLVGYKIASEERLNEVLKLSESENLSFYSALIESNIISNDHLVKLTTELLAIRRVDLVNIEIDQKDLELISEEESSKFNIICFDREKDNIQIAVADPQTKDLEEFLNKKFKDKYKIYLTTFRDVSAKALSYKKELSKAFEDLIKKTTKEASENEFEETPIIKIIDTIIEYAIAERASDIHIEPRKEYVQVRYRIDGILREVIRLNKELNSALIARLKVISDLRIDEIRAPQDGRFVLDLNKKKMSFRLSIMPAMYGEKAAIRILAESARVTTLEELGFTGVSLERIQNSITKTRGIILATGPTGSGKTSTLYSLLRTLDATQMNISTIEDPIEYEIPFVNQFQVNKTVGLTFATGLRSLLRQDPDVLMVGEIRDEETAKIAVNAALTGHYVLSTLHTTNASGVLPRLLDMGIEPYIVASTVSTLIAQRLVRRICPNCIATYTPDKHQLHQLEMLTSKKYVESLPEQLYYGKGCPACHGNGFVGRTGIFEVLEVSDEIRSLIEEKANGDEIEKQAIKEGMITMLIDGMDKVERGITTLDELLRVLKE